MYGMFYVRSARALPATISFGASLHAACAAAAAPRPPASRSPCRPSSYASLSTRQGASAFNQPLSLDTSSVTSMQYMFYVRSAVPCQQPPQLGPPCKLLAPPPLPHAFPTTRLTCRPLPMHPFRLDRERRRSTSR